jgi:hypothetical protein
MLYWKGISQTLSGPYQGTIPDLAIGTEKTTERLSQEYRSYGRY